MSRIQRAVTLCAVVPWLLGVGLAWSSADAVTAAQAPTQKNPIALSEASLKAGRGVYLKRCSPCHGPTGKGNGIIATADPRPADFTDDTWTHGGTDAEIFKTIKEGVGPAFVMEAFGDRLSDNDIWNVVNYIRDLNKRAKAQPTR